MILAHAACTPPGRRVLRDQLEVASVTSYFSSLVASSQISSISLAGVAPVSYTWRRWRS